MDNTEKKIKFPDGTIIRYYVTEGRKSLDLDDLIKAMQNPANKLLIQEVVADFAMSETNPNPAGTPSPEIDTRKLSDFNKSLLKGLRFNPKEEKEK